MFGRAALPVLVVALAVLAGCVAGPVDSGGTATTETATESPSTTETESPTETTATPVDPAAPVDCGDAWVAFYGVGGDVQDRLWAPDAVSVGYTVPEETTLFFVAYVDGGYENGTVVGVERVRNRVEYPVTGDGMAVELDRSLSGERTVRVVAHADTDGDGEFDREVDGPCRSGDGGDDGLVRAGPSTFDFDEFAERTDG